MLKKFNKILRSRNQPFSHYRENHGNIPPWVMIKGMTFGEAIYWYKLSKTNIRELIASRMLGYDNVNVFCNLDERLNVKQAFGDMLNLFLHYRNLTAHCGRVYNHRSTRYGLRNSKFIYREEIIDISRNKFLEGKMRSSVGTLVIALNCFDNPLPFEEMYKGITSLMKTYFYLFPEDFEYLINEMELKQTIIYSELKT